MTPGTSKILGSLAAALVWVATALPAAGQSNPQARRLQAATGLKCSFSVLATGNWQQNKPQATVTDATLELGFSSINIDEGTAEADSEFGESFISVRYSQGYLHFLQMSIAGPLYVTTVFARDAGEGRMLATHTRLEYSPTMVPGFTSRPEMYVGSCAVE